MAIDMIPRTARLNLFGALLRVYVAHILLVLKILFRQLLEVATFSTDDESFFLLYMSRLTF